MAISTMDRIPFSPLASLPDHTAAQVSLTRQQTALMLATLQYGAATTISAEMALLYTDAAASVSRALRDMTDLTDRPAHVYATRQEVSLFLTIAEAMRRDLGALAWTLGSWLGKHQPPTQIDFTPDEVTERYGNNLDDMAEQVRDEYRGAVI